MCVWEWEVRRGQGEEGKSGGKVTHLQLREESIYILYAQLSNINQSQRKRDQTVMHAEERTDTATFGNPLV